MSGYSINQAHLIHDHSSGRSSTRLHAPPGGASSISFGWGQENEPPRVAMSPPKSIATPPKAVQAASPQPTESPGEDRKGFGDTGHSCVRLHAPAGGSNALGTSFAWAEPEGKAPPQPAEHVHKQSMPSAKVVSNVMQVGSTVIYRQLGSNAESVAQIVEIEPVGSRKDNYKIRFEDGRERNTTVDKLRLVQEEEAPEEGMERMNVQDENVPPAETSSPFRKTDFQDKRIGDGVKVQAVQGAGVGELSIGQKVLYKQTPRSDPEEVVVVDVELPGHNGSMRTKTYYHIQVKQPGRVCSSCFL
uniref:Uncharacterized protein n=1 Tax=Guillardia theta TaxID=55529 RepID=A0A6U5Z1R8_GUITH|mmetsp:Transcript_23788/g.77524  ORF Transcript_23788/g.77524 Transcript_23788/m.77524 type:complete len:302 (+) Transcript_23788:277-1182(+)